MQLYHGGRLAVPALISNNETFSASSVAPLLDRGFYSIEQAPTALTTADVYKIIEDFAEGTRRAIDAGFDGVELHGASGYLIQQFVSPHSNHRSDEFKSAATFSLKLIEAVKATIKQYAQKPFLIGYRFSPEEPETPGITMDETFSLIDQLLDKGLDYLHIATTNAWAGARRGSGSETEKSRTQLLAEYIAGRIPLVGVGNIHTGADIDDVMSEAGADLIAVGRVSC